MSTRWFALATACVLGFAASAAHAWPRSHRRGDLRGVYVSAAAGVTVIDYDKYDEGSSNPGVRLQLGGGWAITPRFVVLAQWTWAYTDETPYEFRQVTAGIGARGYLTRWLWSQWMVGAGWLSVKQHRVNYDLIAAGPGPSLEGVVGVDVVRGERFAAALELRLSWTDHRDEGDVTTASVLFSVASFSWF